MVVHVTGAVGSSVVVLIFGLLLLGVAWAVSRIFVKSWAAFFMAAAMLAFGMYFGLAVPVVIRTQIVANRQADAPGWVYAVVALVAGLLASVPVGWLFVRWRRHELKRSAVGAFD